jgi:hypothetical protein
MDKIIARVYGKIKIGEREAHLKRIDIFTNKIVERDKTYVDLDFNYIWYETELIIKPEIGWEIEYPGKDYDWGDSVPKIVGIKLTKSQSLMIEVGWPLNNYYEILLHKQ